MKNTEVDQYMFKLDYPLKEEVEKIRALILEADENITEHIKWNAPSFCYNGEDRITFKLNRKDRIELIFHRGAKVKDNKNFKFETNSELIKWIDKDRGLITFLNQEDLNDKKANFIELAKKWLKETSNIAS